jgi:hypothetical protein
VAVELPEGAVEDEALRCDPLAAPAERRRELGVVRGGVRGGWHGGVELDLRHT